jgi:hypothetical protein
VIVSISSLERLPSKNVIARNGCEKQIVKLTFRGRSVLGPEVLQIVLISLILRRLLVLSQPRVILLFCAVGLTFALFTLFGGHDLPSLAHHLGDFSETKILPLETLSHTYERLADVAKGGMGTDGLRISHMLKEVAPVHSHRPVDGQRTLEHVAQY